MGLTLDFLKADQVGLTVFEKLRHLRYAQPHGIDVPGNESELHDRPVA